MCTVGAGVLLGSLSFHRILQATYPVSTISLPFSLFSTFGTLSNNMADVRPPYRISGLDGLTLGRIIAPSTANNNSKPSKPTSQVWHFPPGNYTPKQVVEHVAPLLESLLLQLGPDPPGAPSSHEILIAGLRSCLSSNTSESTLSIKVDSRTDSSRKEMAQQASRIGDVLVQHAQEAIAPYINAKLVVRSPCEGHLWTSDVVQVLMGRRSNGMLMQIYNEWLHQLVLLRDALLPFENFNDVQLNFKPNSPPGTRPMEKIRSQFLLELMTTQVKRSTILDVAKVFTAPGLPSGGYGFQYAHGTVIPTSLLTGAPSVLLRYVPAILDEEVGQKEILFDNEHKDYYSVPRTEIDKPAATFPSAYAAELINETSLSSKLADSTLNVTLAKAESGAIRQIKLQGSFEDESRFSIDLGQIARGLRYAYRAPAIKTEYEKPAPASPESWPFFMHKAADVLAQPDLVTSNRDGLHVILAASPIVRMALLGKLYPENVVLLKEGQALSDALRVGKAFGPKFVIVGGEVGL